ncbi:MAG: toll/interleukin-1 receptor domain-containing protein [Caulobacteraceae bacterium]
MADVFISYSRLDHDRVQPIADRLSSLGYSIWWDKHLRAGQVFVDEIERQLDGARAVLTAWSVNACNSTWVYAESSRGLDAKKFLQLRLDDARLPLPFEALQVAEMSSGKSEWGKLEDTLTRVVRDRMPPPPIERLPKANALATPPQAGTPRLLTAATTAALVAYSGAVSATYNGVMTPDQLQMAMWGVLGVGGVCAAVTAQRLLTIRRAGG